MIHPDSATLAIIVGCLAASFFFSGTETAFFALQKPERERFSRGTVNQRQVGWLLARKAALITTILLGNEAANISLAAMSAELVPHDKPWLTVLVVPPVVVLVSEITPKVLAYRFRRQWAPAVAFPFTAWFWAATPFRIVFSGIVAFVSRLLGVVDRGDTVAEDELMVYVDHGAASGELDPLERDIIEAVFEFDDLTVERLMTPRPDVFGVPLTIAWPDLLELCRKQGLSRIPVTGHAPDDIVGVLLLKDLLKFRQVALAGPKQLRSLLLPPVFVPASKSADSMLREFLEKRFHMAFVVDEHGTFVGLVTLDDLIGELIGTDDDDDDESDIARTPNAGWADAMTVKASIDLEDFAEETGIRLPGGDYHTLGGFVFHQLGRLPRKGESVMYGEHRFLVSQMEGRRVSEIVVTSSTPAPAPDQEAM
ncbi:MAG: hemolysin family protein [Myxococcota bacterium]